VQREAPPQCVTGDSRCSLMGCCCRWLPTLDLFVCPPTTLRFILLPVPFSLFEAIQPTCFIIDPTKKHLCLGYLAIIIIIIIIIIKGTPMREVGRYSASCRKLSPPTSLCCVPNQAISQTHGYSALFFPFFERKVKDEMPQLPFVVRMRY